MATKDGSNRNRWKPRPACPGNIPNFFRFNKGVGFFGGWDWVKWLVDGGLGD